MQERPDKNALLMAIARFLLEDARPALSDPRLSFRALIAAHLANVVASELRSDEDFLRRELERLRAIFPDAPDPGASLAARHALVAELDRRLAARLREGSASEAELASIAAALRESLREKLAIENPRFDTALDIE
jgi:hypothetical protein